MRRNKTQPAKRYLKFLIVIGMLCFATATIAQQRKTGDAMLDSLIAKKDSIMVKSRLNQLSNGSERDLLTLLNYYANTPPKGDSIIREIVKRFPTGNYVLAERLRELFKENDPKLREKLLLDLKRKFSSGNLDQGYGAASMAYAKEGNLAKAKQYQSMIKNESSRESTAAMNAQELLKFNAPAAESLLKPEVERLRKAWLMSTDKSRGRYYAFASLYGSILMKEEKYVQAQNYISEAYENTLRRDAELTANYGLLMSQTGYHDKALPVLTRLVDEGKANERLKAAFTESFVQSGSGTGTAADYLQKAEQALTVKAEAEVAKNLISQPSPNFRIKDINGKMVSLNDFKGKIIVLDFWATWCGPCKASFPAMQRVVNLYKGDPNVKFLFIHTREVEVNPLPAAQKYLKENNYTFDLYIDPKNPATKKSEAVTAFGADGIPAKFVVDQNGVIRFKMIGFSGSDDYAVRELTSMIQTVKKGAR